MQDLQLIGVHEDGEHLLLSGPDDTRFRMPIDEALRAAIRRDRPRLGHVQTDVDGGLRPRDVQALVRAGASAEEVAERAGWTVEKVHRFEGPILAEREHIAGLARKARLRARSGAHSGGGAPTLSVRVAERLRGRGVDEEDASWDSWRAEGGPWTVVLTFAAGGRQRQASWSFDLADRTVSAVDDEARWLSEDVEATDGPIRAPELASRSARATMVYDVEAEGGLTPTPHVKDQEDPLDLMSAMRKRSTARGRRKSGGQRVSTKGPTAHGAQDQSPEQVRSEMATGLEEPADNGIPVEETVREEMAREATARAGTARRAAVRPATAGPATAGPATAGTGTAREGTARQGTSRAGTARTANREGTAREDSSSRGRDNDLESVAPPQDEPTLPASRPSHRETARKHVRPSVPAWDEIMFGSRPDADRSSS